MSTGSVDIYELKHSQRHLLAAIESNLLETPILKLISGHEFSLRKSRESVDNENSGHFSYILDI